MNQQRVALITGASSGIGRACAAHLHLKGWRVFGTSRKPADEAQWTMIAMDVDDDESVQRGVKAVIAQCGRIDLVVNNAGFGLVGSAEDTTIDEAKAQLETNMWGVWRVCQAVLPPMKAQAAGTIINISSVAGLMGWPFHAAYTASKYAVEGFTETLRMEVAPAGINIVLVEPGDVQTNFTAQRRHTAHTSAAYRDRLARALTVIEHDEQHGSPPEQVAVLIERIANTRHPRLRYRIGPRLELVAIALKRVVPERVFEWAIMTYYRIR